MQVALYKLWLQQLVMWQRLHILLQVHAQELKDQVEFILLHEHIHERDNIRMLELSEQRDLSDGCAWNALFIVLEANLLQGDHLIGDLVLALVDDTISTLANLLDLHVVGERIADTGFNFLIHDSNYLLTYQASFI